MLPLGESGTWQCVARRNACRGRVWRRRRKEGGKHVQGRDTEQSKGTPDPPLSADPGLPRPRSDDQIFGSPALPGLTHGRCIEDKCSSRRFTSSRRLFMIRQVEILGESGPGGLCTQPSTTHSHVYSHAHLFKILLRCS